MPVLPEAHATDRVDDAPDLSSLGATLAAAEPWDSTGATTSQQETAAGVGANTVWHKVLCLVAGQIAVTQNPSVPLPSPPASGDTYLHVLQGPLDGSELTDATLTQRSLIVSDDDSAGSLKGAVTIEGKSGVWYYIGSRSYSGGPIANQWVSVSLPKAPPEQWAPAAELDPADTGHALATPILSRRERIPAYQATGVIDAGADAEPLTGQIWPR